MTDPVTILFADASIVTVNKPPGLTVVPGAGEQPGDCLRGRLERQVGARLWVVHRLDRETSGVVLFARTAEAHRTLCLAFEERRVQKTYVAFTLGVPSPRESRITTPLHPARRGKVRPAAPGENGAWDAATRYIVRRSWERLGTSVALVEAQPETGRHHQIRAHLRSIGTPVLFDKTYGRRSAGEWAAGSPVSRLALHASRLVVPDAAQADLTHTFDAPLAADLAALLHWLDGNGTGAAVATSSPG